MKINPLILALYAFISTCFTFQALAATDITVIDISHTYTPYVNLTGTAPGASRFYDNNDLVDGVSPRSVNLGTMGLESNVSGTCDLNFTTANNFKLLHAITNNNLGDYKIQYKGLEFNETNNPLLQIPCTSDATDINFQFTALVSLSGIDPFLDAGVYRDVVTVIVTTQ